MGLSSEALHHYFGGTDSEDYGFDPGPRRHKEASEQTPRTCRRCGERNLHWRETRDGWRLHQIAAGVVRADGTIDDRDVVVLHTCGGLQTHCTLCGKYDLSAPCENPRCGWYRPFLSSAEQSPQPLRDEP